MQKEKILIAGIAGASLGTEILKSLSKSGIYDVYGCDISVHSYGHYQSGFVKTFVPSIEKYIEDIIAFCKTYEINFIIPGGEAPLNILFKNIETLLSNGIRVIGNSKEIISNFSDKAKTFEILKGKGFKVPFTVLLKNEDDISSIPSFPCIIKPAIGTGGSVSVFLVTSADECRLYFKLLLQTSEKIIAQQYMPLDEGEFTIGVLSLPDQSIIGCVVMKRIFSSKLSISFKSSVGLISSGYSQGFIGNFPKLEKQAIAIAKEIGSQGPINIQARVLNGELMPFEINPRFSASTYLRTLAGFNEIDFFLRNLIFDTKDFPYRIQEGYYLRSFEETYIPTSKILNL